MKQVNLASTESSSGKQSTSQKEEQELLNKANILLERIKSVDYSLYQLFQKSLQRLQQKKLCPEELEHLNNLIQWLEDTSISIDRTIINEISESEDSEENKNIQVNFLSNLKLKEHSTLTIGNVTFVLKQVNYAKENKVDKKIYRHLPPHNPDFSGRMEEIKKINEYLKQKNVCTISGLGGVGKTQLAKQYAYEFIENYNLVWWFDAEKGLEKGYRELAEKLEIAESNVKVESEKIVQAVFEKLQVIEKNWLLIYDNAETPLSLRNYIPRKQPGSTGHILITSRNPHWSSTLPLVAFSEDEAENYLQHLLEEASCKPNKLTLKNLTRKLGKFPLALTQAGSYMKYYDKTVEEYLTEFEKTRIELWEKEKDQHSNDQPYEYDDYTKTIKTTIQLSLDKLKEISKSNLASVLLNLMSFVHADTIPQTCLAVAAEENGYKSHEFDQAIKALKDHSLIALSTATYQDKPCYAVHELVMQVVRDNISQEEYPKWIGKALRMLAKKFTWKDNNLAIHIHTAITYAEKLKLHQEFTAFPPQESYFNEKATVITSLLCGNGFASSYPQFIRAIKKFFMRKLAIEISIIEDPTEIDLSFVNLNNGEIQHYLIDRILKAPQLEKLGLENTEIGRKEIELIANALKNHKEIKEINLIGNSLQESVDILSSLLKKNSTINILWLGYNKLENVHAKKLSLYLKEIYRDCYIDLTNNWITEDGIASLLETVKENPFISINLFDNPSFPNIHKYKNLIQNNNLENRVTIGASNRIIGTTNATDFFHLMALSIKPVFINYDSIPSTITILNLEDKNLDDVAAKKLIEVIGNFSQLRQLNLSGNHISAEVIDKLLQKIVTHPTICEIDLSDCTPWENEENKVKLKIYGDSIAFSASNLLRQNPKIECLKLSKLAITEKGAKLLAEAMKIHKNIRKIDVSSNEINETGLVALIQTLNLNAFIVSFLANHQSAYKKNQEEHSNSPLIKLCSDILKSKPLLQYFHCDISTSDYITFKELTESYLAYPREKISQKKWEKIKDYYLKSINNHNNDQNENAFNEYANKSWRANFNLRQEFTHFSGIALKNDCLDDAIAFLETKGSNSSLELTRLWLLRAEICDSQLDKNLYLNKAKNYFVNAIQTKKKNTSNYDFHKIILEYFIFLFKQKMWDELFNQIQNVLDKSFIPSLWYNFKELPLLNGALRELADLRFQFAKNGDSSRFHIDGELVFFYIKIETFNALDRLTEAEDEISRFEKYIQERLSRDFWSPFQAQYLMNAACKLLGRKNEGLNLIRLKPSYLDGLDELIHLINISPNLTNLTLIEADFTSEKHNSRLLQAIEKHPTLSSINFKECRFPYKDENNDKVQEKFVVTLAACLQQNPRIMQLQLSHTILTEDNLELLAPVIKNHPALKSLDITYRENQAQSSGIVILLSALQLNHSITSISLESYGNHDEKIHDEPKISEQCLKLLAEHPEIQHFDINIIWSKDQMASQCLKDVYLRFPREEMSNELWEKAKEFYFTYFDQKDSNYSYWSMGNGEYYLTKFSFKLYPLLSDFGEIAYKKSLLLDAVFFFEYLHEKEPNNRKYIISLAKAKLLQGMGANNNNETNAKSLIIQASNHFQSYKDTPSNTVVYWSDENKLELDYLHFLCFQQRWNDILDFTNTSFFKNSKVFNVDEAEVDSYSNFVSRVDLKFYEVEKPIMDPFIKELFNRFVKEDSFENTSTITINGDILVPYFILKAYKETNQIDQAESILRYIKKLTRDHEEIESFFYNECAKILNKDSVVSQLHADLNLKSELINLETGEGQENDRIAEENKQTDTLSAQQLSIAGFFSSLPADEAIDELEILNKLEKIQQILDQIYPPENTPDAIGKRFRSTFDKKIQEFLAMEKYEKADLITIEKLQDQMLAKQKEKQHNAHFTTRPTP